MSTIKVDTITTRTGSGNITLSNSLADVTINRTGNGVAQTIQNSGTTVGQIGVNSTDNMYLVSTNTGFKLLKDEAAIAPAQSGGSNHDNALDLGVSGVRWKDLYLSGGLKIGGTGTANTLDDYEEGTWTPVFAASSGNPTVSYGAQNGTYTKIGRYVYTTFFVQINSVSSQGSGNLRIGPLPFALTTAHGYAVENGATFYEMGGLGRTINAGTGRGIGTDQILLTNMNTGGGAQSLNTGALTGGYVIGSYMYITDV